MVKNTSGYYTGWQKELITFFHLGSKIALSFPHVSLMNDYVAVEIEEGTESFLPLKPALPYMFNGNVLYFGVHGFYSYSLSQNDLQLLLQEAETGSGRTTGFDKTFGDGILPHDDPGAIYPRCVNLIKRLFTKITAEELLIVVDCRGLKESFSPDGWRKTRILFDDIYSARNTLLFLSLDDDEIPCDSSYKIAVDYPDYFARKHYFSDSRFADVPAIKNDADRFYISSSHHSLSTIEKYTSISRRDGIEDVNELFRKHQGNGRDPFATYNKSMVKNRLEKELSRIKGNDSVKKRIIEDIVALFGGMNWKKKDDSCVPPPRIYFMTGPGGCGKTEIARGVGRAFGTEKSLVKIPLGQHNSSASVNDLLGSSRGYIGYNDRSPFEPLIDNHDITVVIFDEAEKADPAITKALLQVLNDGLLTLRDGRVVDFRYSFIFFTSNLGVQKKVTDSNGNDVLDAYGQPLQEPAFDIDTPEEEVRQILVGAVREFYNSSGVPEFLNRITMKNILPLTPLSEQGVNEIVQMLCGDVIESLHNDYGCDLLIFEEAYEKLLKAAFSIRAEQGRGVTKMVNRVFDMLRSFDTTTKNIMMRMEDDNIVFTDMDTGKKIKKEIR